MLRFTFLIFYMFYGSSLAARSHISEFSSTRSFGQAEAFTGSVTQEEALHYNPAGLAHSGFQFGLLSLEANYDRDSAQRISESREENDLDIGTFYSKLQSETPIQAAVRGTIAKLIFPHFGFHGFARQGIELRQKTTSEATYHLKSQSEAGIAIGTALTLGKLSVGVSQYLIARSIVSSSVPNDDREAIIAATKKNSLEDNIDLVQQYTEFKYGGARGSNGGLIYRWWGNDNPSGLGISVLNADDTRFEQEIPVSNKKIKEKEEELLAKANEYGLDLTTPDNIPQIVNAGISVGQGDPNSGFFWIINVDHFDLEKKHFDQNYLGASYHAGLKLPRAAALAMSAIVFSDRDGRNWHMGFGGASAFGGIREGSYFARGWDIDLHFGVDRKISFATLKYEYAKSTSLGSLSTAIEQESHRVTLGADLIF